MWRYGKFQVVALCVSLELGFISRVRAEEPAGEYAAIVQAFSQEGDAEKKLILADQLLDVARQRWQNEIAGGADAVKKNAAAISLSYLEKDRPDLEELKAKHRAATDPSNKKNLADQIQLTEFEIAETGRLHEAWLLETDVKKKEVLAGELVRAAIHSWHHPEVVVEVATDGKFAERQIIIPDAAERVSLVPIHDVGRSQPSRYNFNNWREDFPWVIRRITRQTLEVWRPDHGWLFDQKGNLLNEAKPPRRDGYGREWHGAFLPDGRWATTDLWELDKTLYLYSRDGKRHREITSSRLLSSQEIDPFTQSFSQSDLIAWCRADRDGTGWVTSIGSDGGKALVWVHPGGRFHTVTRPYQLCYPRDLEPKKTLNWLSIPADSGQAGLTRSEAAHGMGVGFPVYDNGQFSRTVPGGLMGIESAHYAQAHSPAFGFWPDSRDVYIGVQGEDNGAAEEEKPGTWFYRANGFFVGWLRASRLADGEEGKGMLFDGGQGRIITVNAQYRVEKVRQFFWPDGSVARPEKIFSDLHLGFFQHGEEAGRTLVLARW